jgi:hypothetical protein
MENKNSKRNDVYDENTGNSSVTKVTIAVDDDAAPSPVTTTMTGIHPWQLLRQR